MSTESVLAQLQGGDACGALASLRRLVDTAQDEAGAQARLALLDLACAELSGGDPAAYRAMLEGFEAAHPDWEEPGLRLALHLAQAGEPLAAELAYGRCVDRNPVRPEVLAGLGLLLLRRGAMAPAEKLLKLCCALAPANDEAWNNLGLCLLALNQAVLALGAFSKAQRLAPQNIAYALNRVDAALATGGAERELARLEAESARDPCNVAHLTARGELLGKLGERDAAIDLLEAAATLAPEEKLPIARLAERLVHSQRPKEADAALRTARALDPDNAKLGIMHSVVLLRLMRFHESQQLLEEMMQRGGEDSALLGNLSTATLALGNQEQAVEQVRRALDLAPENASVWRTLSNTLPYRDGVTGAELLAAARETARRWPRGVMPAFTNSVDPERRLRVGLLSGSLKMHPIGWLTIAGFEALDPGAFELVRLTAFPPDDFIGERFATIAPECHDSGRFDDHDFARHIRAIGIDILIDLGGYGDLGRMPLCAHRAAPVQIKWVGMQNHTTALDEMDWMITDRWETPPDLERYYTERPLRMADGYVCYSPPPDAPEVGELPALARGQVTFGCFNNLSKVTRPLIATWCRLLHRLPSARLLLKAPQFSDVRTREDILERFAAHGIGAERLTLRGASPHRVLLSEYNEVDIVLDPFPYNGGLTTCEALWMGVPTVTLPGEIFAARHSLSHLSNVGLGDWAASDIDGYLDLAVAKAADLAGLAALRAGLREQVRQSPLCDGPRFGRSLSAGLRHAWREWARQQSAPASAA